jgi:hypothetical protein
MLNELMIYKKLIETIQQQLRLHHNLRLQRQIPTFCTIYTWWSKPPSQFNHLVDWRYKPYLEERFPKRPLFDSNIAPEARFNPQQTSRQWTCKIRARRHLVNTSWIV